MPFLVGLLLLATSMALQTASHSVGMYLAGRALQGASAAAVWVIGLALVVDTVDSNKLGEYLGYVSWAMSLGALMGPILGGVVYDSGGYYVSHISYFGCFLQPRKLPIQESPKNTSLFWTQTK